MKGNPHYDSPWTTERVELLKVRWPDISMQLRNIVAEIGLSHNAVIGKAFRLKLASRRAARPPAEGRKRPKSRTKTSVLWAAKANQRAARPTRIIPDHDIPLEQRKTLLELTNKTCRWPVGDPSDQDHFYCGGEALLPLPYCAMHCRRAYRDMRAALRQAAQREKEVA